MQLSKFTAILNCASKLYYFSALRNCSKSTLSANTICSCIIQLLLHNYSKDFVQRACCRDSPALFQGFAVSVSCMHGCTDRIFPECFKTWMENLPVRLLVCFGNALWRLKWGNQSTTSYLFHACVLFCMPIIFAGQSPCQKLTNAVSLRFFSGQMSVYHQSQYFVVGHFLTGVFNSIQFDWCSSVVELKNCHSTILGSTDNGYLTIHRNIHATRESTSPPR